MHSNNKFYAMILENRAIPGETSIPKLYFGNLNDIEGLVTAIAGDEKLAQQFDEMLRAYRDFENGNADAHYEISGNRYQLLTEARLIDTRVTVSEEYEWDHISLYGQTYRLKTSNATFLTAWFELDNRYYRCIKAKCLNLEYIAGFGSGKARTGIEDGAIGFPHVIEIQAQPNGAEFTYNRLFEIDKSFNSKSDMTKDMKSHSKEVNLTTFCDDMFTGRE